MDLFDLLQNYKTKDNYEEECRIKMIKFLLSNSNAFSRKNKYGHFTASALLLNPQEDKFIILLHKKLGIWVQPGGHCDENKDALSVAIKECQEETGLYNIEPIETGIFDINIHLVPKFKDEDEHYHYDICFLLKSMSNDMLINNDKESLQLKWCNISDYKAENLAPSTNRMIEKLIAYKLEYNFI